MLKEQWTDYAWEKFIERNPDILVQIAEEGKKLKKDEKNILRAIWRIGFWYALDAVQDGRIKLEQIDSDSGKN